MGRPLDSEAANPSRAQAKSTPHNALIATTSYLESKYRNAPVCVCVCACVYCMCVCVCVCVCVRVLYVGLCLGIFICVHDTFQEPPDQRIVVVEANVRYAGEHKAAFLLNL